MGRAFAGDWVLIDLSGALAAVAQAIGRSGSRIGCERESPRRRSACHYSTGFACGFVFAQACFVQTDADVGSGEANQRRRQLVEPDRARLPLLVATVADGIQLVGG